jgi:CxxC-x17-CxxC domain-containing protein
LAGDLITCVECGAQFEFPAEERARFAARGFETPKRCRTCRSVKRRRNAANGGQQQQQRRGGERRQAHGSGNGASVSPAPRHGGDFGAPAYVSPAPTRPDNRPPREMHPAVCTVCGAATEVPFIADGVRPVYCLPCLKQRTR